METELDDVSQLPTYQPSSLRDICGQVAFSQISQNPNSKHLLSLLPQEIIELYINKPLDRGRGPLCFASLQNIPLLIQHGASIDQHDHLGNSAFTFFMIQGKFEHAKIALESQKVVPLDCAQGNHVITDILNYLDDIDEKERADELEILLHTSMCSQNNAKLNKQHTLSVDNWAKILTLLLSIDPKKNIFRRTKFHNAQDPEELKFLLQHNKLAIEGADLLSYTPLTYHLGYRSLPCAQTLLSEGVFSESALDFAIRLHLTSKILKQLIINGKIVVTDSYSSNSYLACAALYSNNEALKLITQHAQYSFAKDLSAFENNLSQDDFNSYARTIFKEALLICIKKQNLIGCKYLAFQLKKHLLLKDKKIQDRYVRNIIYNDEFKKYAQEKKENPDAQKPLVSINLRDAARHYLPEALEYLDLFLIEENSEIDTP